MPCDKADVAVLPRELYGQRNSCLQCTRNGQANMASFLRGKQAGIQRDFSAGLDPQLFAIDEVGC